MQEINLNQIIVITLYRRPTNLKQSHKRSATTISHRGLAPYGIYSEFRFGGREGGREGGGLIQRKDREDKRQRTGDKRKVKARGKVNHKRHMCVW